MEFQKKDLTDYLILEMDDLEPINECYFFYYNNLLDIIDDNREKNFKELINNLKETIILKYNKIIDLIKHYYNKIYIKDEENEYEEEEEDYEEVEYDDKIDYRIEFINTIKKCDLDNINQFMKYNKFRISKDILEKRLKRHIIIINKNR